MAGRDAGSSGWNRAADFAADAEEPTAGNCGIWVVAIVGIFIGGDFVGLVFGKMVMVAEQIESTPVADPPRMRVLAPLEGEEFAQVRREMTLRCCKWDPQVGDISTLARFPLAISNACWEELAGLAEKLAEELGAAEWELLHRPDLHGRLGIPWSIRRCLRRCGAQADSPRLMRFDFHWTSEGWRISEVNSDVPGGFTESSSFPMLMARHYEGFETLGDVAEEWTRTMVERAQERPIALMS